MQATRPIAIRELRKEAENLRAWADLHLPEPQRLEPYTLAARLERLALELATEPVLQRLGGEVRDSTRTWLGRAQRFKRR